MLDRIFEDIIIIYHFQTMPIKVITYWQSSPRQPYPANLFGGLLWEYDQIESDLYLFC